MICDMCSAKGRLYKVKVEGAELTLCKDCSKFGEVIGQVQQESESFNKKQKTIINEGPELIEILSEDYADKIKKKRESLGLSQKDFAEKLNEKESIIQKLENWHLEPSIDLAKKIEKSLGLKILEQYEEKHEKQNNKGSMGTFTIGDFIKIKK